jgi:hypothetical protein
MRAPELTRGCCPTICIGWCPSPIFYGASRGRAPLRPSRMARGITFAIGHQGTVEGVKGRGDRATALIENIWVRENPWLQLQGGGTSYSMSAMPRWRPNSASQRSDAMSQQATSEMKEPN